MFSVSFSETIEMQNLSFTDIYLSKKLIFVESSAIFSLFNVTFQMKFIDVNMVGVSNILDGGFIRIENSLNMEFFSLRILFSAGNQNIGIVIVNQIKNSEKIAKYFNFTDTMQVKHFLILLKYNLF